MNSFLCPTCGARLQKQEKLYRCGNGHCIDRAKSGYVNLLMANEKHSPMPGDNKLMVDARRSFLEKGYYRPLLDELCGLVQSRLPERGGLILDAGCGEGYYTAGLAQAVASSHPEAGIMGIDISKLAVDKAAKRCKTVDFAVASVFRLPVESASCDMALNLFAPFYQPELQRVLKSAGVFVMVIPGERHLWELKQAIYERPYLNEVKDFYIEGFQLLEHRHLEREITLTEQADIAHLFQMTPYYYKTAQQDYERLFALNSLTTRIEFELLVYRQDKAADADLK